MTQKKDSEGEVSSRRSRRTVWWRREVAKQKRDSGVEEG